MINKLAVYYKVENARLQQLERALLTRALQVQQRIAGTKNPHIRVMVAVEGAAEQTPHVISQGYTPTALRAFIEFGHEEAALGSLIDVAGALLPPVATMVDADGSCALAGREYV